MDVAELMEAAWPWIWPSLALAAWVAGWAFALHRSRQWLAGRSDPGVQPDLFRLSDVAVQRLMRFIFVGVLVLGTYAWMLWAPLPAGVQTVVREELTSWVMATILLIVFVAGGFYAVRRGMFFFGLRAAKTDTRLDDAIIAALNRPLYVTVVLLGINLWAAVVPLPEAIAAYISRGSETAIVVLIFLLVDGMLQGWMIARSEHSTMLKTSGAVLRAAVRIGVYTIGMLTALSSLGLDVTPILASLGVSSIAIGLALQGTLEDFLAGLLLAADQPIAVGDFVELDDGRAGVVLSIGWRTTRILTREDMHIIAPNSKLAKSTLLNRSRPREACKFTAACGVHYRSNLDEVARLAIEVAIQVQQGDPRGVTAFAPKVVFGGFGDSSIDFGVWLCAKSWEDHFGLKDNFIRSLHRRFDEEGIVIPYPIRTLDVPPQTTVHISGPPR